MTETAKLRWSAAAIGVASFVTAMAFSAYLQPAMLIEFANFVLCS